MAQNNIFGILSNYNINDNLPAVLDAIRWKETGGEKNPLTAIGSSGEIGAFQLNPKHFHNFGFDVQKNITSDQAQDYWSSRKIASDLLEGMKKYRNYDLGQLLAGYNWGSRKVDKWIKSGGKFEDLPDGTQDYLTKVAGKLQEDYTDPLRASNIEVPSSKPKTMMASNDEGINQDYNNFAGDVERSYMNPHYTTKEILQEVVGIKPALGQSTYNTNTKTGNIATMGKQDFQPQLILPFLEKKKAQEFDEFPYLNTPPTIDEIKTPENGWYQDENGLWKNTKMEEFHKKVKEQQALGKEGGAFNKGNDLQNNGVLSNPEQSLQSQLPPNPSMTRNNTNLSTPSNSMMISNGEMLMRMAGAGMGNLGKGSSAALGSALDKYGEIKDTNRLTALELAKAQAEAGVDDETLANIGQIDETMYDMDRALGYLNKYNLTGFFTQYLGTTKDKLFGGKAGNTRQAARKLLEKLRVDDTLLRIAQTKGAISNKEMDLFLSPSPNQGDPEGVWINWIQDRQQALMRVRSRMSTGQTVSQGQQASSNQVNQFSGGTTKTTPSGITYTTN